MLDGSMTQKRVPADQWRWVPRARQLIWVQEDHIEWIGTGRDTAMMGFGFAADGPPRSTILALRPPEHLRNRQYTTNIRRAEAMRASDSRITLEVNETEFRKVSSFMDGEIEAEGLKQLVEWEGESDPMLGFVAFWRRQYGRQSGPVLIIRFRVMKVCVTKLLELRK